MKQKLLTLFAQLCVCVTGAWAGVTDLPFTSLKTIAAGGEIWYTTKDNVGTANTAGWCSLNTNPSNNKYGNITPNLDGDVTEETAFKIDGVIVKGGNTPSNLTSSKKALVFKVTNTSSITAYGATTSGTNSDYTYFRWSIYDTSDNSAIVSSVYGEGAGPGPNKTCTITKDDLDPQKTYIVFIEGGFKNDSKSNQDVVVYAIKFIAPAAGPSITTQPQGAAYAFGQTMDPLTVVAEASAGDLSYQWYKNTTNEAVVDDDHLISGAKSASYTPTEAGFYYVVVTDGNGSVTSDVAEITISAAEAPTINVTGAPTDAVLVGTEVILTAEVTGTPTPTVTWYDNAQNSQEVGTGATFTVPTDNAGTYQYYAVASNGIGTDAVSTLQTIVVKEQVATPTITPNGAYFEESQDVTIECTTEDATVQYSIDNGATWIDMQSKKLTITETTTIKAKAVKDGMIDSEIATATFNKVTLVEQTDVTGAATWDWSKFGKKEIKFTDTTTPKKNDFFVLQNVVSYGWCSSIDADFGDATQLNVSGEYAVRDSKYFQGGYVKFNTTVPGTLEITYSNTGNRSDENERRFVNVNGTNYGEGTMNATAVTTSDIPVAAGEVTIKGTLKGDGSDQYLRINKIVFTPLSDDNVDVVKVTDVNYATYVTTANIDFTKTDGVKAYKVTSVNPTIQYEEVTEAPTGTPLLIAAESASYILQAADPTSVPAEVTDNLLKAADNTVGDGQTIYVLGKKDDKAVWGLLTSGKTLSAGKAYLVIDGSNNAPFYSIEIGDDATTGINLNANDNLNFDQNAPRYNLSGQRVSDSYKGIVIVNGKKVVIK